MMDVFVYDDRGRSWSRPPTRSEIERRVVGWAAFGATAAERTDLLAAIPTVRFLDPVARAVWLHLAATDGPHDEAEIASAVGVPRAVIDGIVAGMRLLKPVEEIEMVAATRLAE